MHVADKSKLFATCMVIYLRIRAWAVCNHLADLWIERFYRFGGCYFTTPGWFQCSLNFATPLRITWQVPIERKAIFGNWINHCFHKAGGDTILRLSILRH